MNNHIKYWLHVENNIKSTFANRAKKAAYTSLWLGIQPVTKLSKRLYEMGMRVQFFKDWRSYPNPEWYDHSLSLALFSRDRLPHFFERGVYASEVVAEKRVLDLCCGDGSVAALFLAPLAKSVVSVDFDPTAIAHAKKRWSKFENCRFINMDIRKLDFEKESFDVCNWEGAIEHFTQAEMEGIFSSLKASLIRGGIIHGSTIKRGDSPAHHEHEYEFKSADELEKTLSKHFENVRVWERAHQDRMNLYFRCSNRA